MTAVSTTNSGNSASARLNSKTADVEKLSQEVEKQQDYLQKVLFALAENQIPGQESDQGANSAAIAQLVSGAAAAQMGKKTFEILMEVAEQLKNAGISSQSELVGQRVSIDDSTRSYSGSKVHFEYTIHGDKPQEASLQAQISILNEKGEKIFKKTIKNPSIGKNVFEWEGVDNDGEKAQHGTYHMEVEATYQQAGQLPVPMHTDSIREGTVEAVDFDEERHPYYVIDGQRIDSTSVRQFLGRSGANGSKTGATKADDIKSYIGDVVEVKQEKVTFSGQKADLNFSTTTTDSKATLRVKIYDAKNRLVAVDEAKDVPVKSGQNVLEWQGFQSTKQSEIDDMKSAKLKPVYLAHDTYRYEISLVSAGTDGQEKVTKLENKGSYTIAAVDTSGKLPMLVSKEGYRFQLGDVTRTEKPVNLKSRTQLLEEANNYIGKVIKFHNNEIEYDGTPTSRKFYIPKPKTADWKVDNVTMHIYGQDGKLVRNITKSGNDAYFEGQEPVPEFTELDNASEEIINNLATDLFNKKYTAISTSAENGDSTSIQNLKALDDQIAKSFKRGELFRDVSDYQNKTSGEQELIRDKNMGLLKFDWDGKDDEGNAAPNGAYKITLTYNEIDSTGKIQGASKEVELASINKVDGVDISHDKVELLFEDGTRFTELEKITYIGV